MADVHAWAPGQVVKLFKSSVPQHVAWWEARMTRAVFAAGFPAPEVLGEVTLEGRFGIVLPRLDGPTLLQLSRTGAMTSEQVGSILATLAISVHKIAPPPEVLSLRDWMDSSLRGSDRRIPQHIATGVLTLIERLPPGDGLCHLDLLPFNVIMTADGPRLIDWLWYGPRARRPRPWGLPHFPFRARPGTRRRSGAAAQPTVRPCSRNTRGWPACPKRR